MRKTLLSFLLVGMAWAQPQASINDMRGDMGLLEDFGPTGACWIGDNRVLVSDRRYTVFHIFDLEGRRFRFIDNPVKQGEANYSALSLWKDDRYFVTGSHYHVKNNPRFVENRSVIHQIV